MQLTRILSASIAGVLLLAGAHAATPQTRPVTLEECIQEALKHNLDVQIQRLGPLMARYTLRGSYASYDPAVDASLDHQFSATTGGIDQQGRLYFPSERESDSVSLGLSGLLPWGLNYRLNTQSSDTYGSRPGERPDPTRPFYITNVVWDPVLNAATSLVSTAYFPQPSRDAFENANAFAGITMSQPLLKNFWADGPRTTIAVNKRRLKSSEFALRGQIMRTVTDVELAYYDLIAARESLRVQQKALELAEQLFRENKKRVEVGVMAVLDEKQAESEVAARRADLLSAQSAVTTTANALKNLLTDHYSDWQDTQLEPKEQLSSPVQVFSRQDSWQKGLTQRPDLLQARLDLEINNIQLRYTHNQLFPELDLRGSYGQNGSAKEFSSAFNLVREGDSPAYSYGVVLSFPLSNRAARYSHRSAKASVDQTLLRLKQLEQSIMRQIDDAIAQAQTSLQRVEATRKAREYAVAALEAEQKKLDNGKSTSFQVLQFQRDVTARRSEEIRASLDYSRASAQLAIYEGATLERHRINLEGY